MPHLGPSRNPHAPPMPRCQNSVDAPALKADLSNDAQALSDVRAFLRPGK
jgi:hypothetical protein